MTNLGPTDAMSQQELLARLKQPLSALLTDSVDRDYDAERQLQITRARSNWMYVRGEHFFAPDFVGDTGIVDFLPINGGEDENDTKQFLYAFNVIGGDLWKFVAATASSSPNVKAVPDDIEDNELIQMARMWDANIRDLRVKWRLDRRQKDVSFHQYTTGPVFGYTPFVTDGDAYGWTVEPKIKLIEEEQPDGTVLPVPVEDGQEKYPNGDSELHLCNLLEVTVPFGKKTLKQCEYLDYTYLENKYKLLSLYEDELRGDQEGGTDYEHEGSPNAQTTALEAQDAVQAPSGSGKSHKENSWLFSRCWLRPFMYKGIKDLELRKTLAEQFPDGMKVTRVRGRLVKVEHESMDEVWAVCKTGRGEYIHSNPICHDSVPIQKAINDFFGLAIETILRAIPKTFMDQTLLDRKALKENRAIPGEVVPVRTTGTMDISKMMAPLPMSHFSDQLVPFANLMREYDHDISGIRPEIAGGGAPTQTFREARQRRDQALSQLQPPVDEQREFVERLYENGIRQRAKHGSGRIKAPAGHGDMEGASEVVELSMLTAEGVHCEADEGFPVNQSERSDRLYELLKDYPPEVVNALAILDNMNVQQVQQLLSLSGFQSPVENARQALLEDIRLLLAEQPIEQIDMMGSVVLMPSIPPEPSVDDHAFCVDFLRKWCKTSFGRKAKAQNRPGYDNVVARLEAHEQILQAMSVPPPGEEVPPGEEAPGEGPPPAEQPAEPLPPIDAPGQAAPMIQ